MVIAKYVLVAAAALPGQLSQPPGSISGSVLHLSAGRKSPCQATVVLCMRVEGQLVPIRETDSDAQGRFRFDHLPLGDGCVYHVGANRDGVHYPGARLQLTPAEPRATVELKVYDAVAQPNPLVIRRWEITLCPQPGALRVTESMLVDNPSLTCYVGRALKEGAEPATLQLAIPAEFERATFAEEFFGRRFSVVDDRVVTGIPWPPGQRELKFTYVLRNAQTDRLWQRPLDLPCSQIVLRVRTAKPEEVACDLPRHWAGSSQEVVFESAGQVLPAGHVLRVAMGHLPVSWMAYARTLAIGILLSLVAAAGFLAVNRRRQGKSAATADSGSPPTAPAGRGSPAHQGPLRSKRQQAAASRKTT